MTKSRAREKITSLMLQEAFELFKLKGTEALSELGKKTVENIITSVLCGENIRSTTETITRGRLTLGNAYLLLMILKGNHKYEDFFNIYLDRASDQLPVRGLNTKEDKWILFWLLGLTEKGKQNILRDTYGDGLAEYAQDYDETISTVADDCEARYGAIRGSIELDGYKSLPLSWNTILRLMAVVGAQTLTLRGSDKSRHGKLFEKLILASALHIQGFRFVDRETNTSFDKIFWLSYQDEKRESDATAIYSAGRGMIFDIGFIGRGNPEITLDKVTRFGHQIEYRQRTHTMNTVILVDRIGESSRIVRMAREYNNYVVQMSEKDWMKQMAQIMANEMGKPSPTLDMDTERLHHYIEDKIKAVPVDMFIASS